MHIVCLKLEIFDEVPGSPATNVTVTVYWDVALFSVLVTTFRNSCVMKMEATHSFETLITVYWTVPPVIPEDSNLYSCVFFESSSFSQY